MWRAHVALCARRCIAAHAVILSSAFTPGAGAQSVLVAPSVVVIDGRTRTSAITLVNTGNTPAEVTLGITFGIPVTDSAGAMRLATFTTVDDSMPSAAEFVHAYPSQFVLLPGGRRVVRLLATPPAGTADGEYWARLVVTTRAARTRPLDADDATDVGAARIGIDLEIRSLLPVFYRQGAVTTRVEIDSLRPSVDGDSVHVRVPMTRRGNAAFVGAIHAVLRDSAGTVRASTLLPLGVYYELSPLLALSRRGLAGGVYMIEVEAASSRPDVGGRYLLQTRPVWSRQPIRLVPSRQ